MIEESSILPKGFSWPDEEPLSEINDFMPTVEIAFYANGADPGFAPGVIGTRASHNIPDPEIEVHPMQNPVNLDFKQFSMQNPKLEAGQWSVEVFPGWVYDIDPKKAHEDPAPAGGTDPLQKFMPELNTTPLNELVGTPEKPPRLNVEAGDTVSLKIERNKKGEVQGPVTVVVRPAGNAAHYHPEIVDEDSGGGEQFLYWDVFDVESDGGTGIKSKPLWQDDVALTPFLWTGENIGDGENVLKEYVEDLGLYRFRTLLKDWGIIVRTEPNQIEFELNQINFGDDGAGGSDPGTVGEPILLSKAESITQGKDLVAILRRIAEGDVSNRRQITIKKVDGAIHVMGNDIHGSITYDDSTADPPTTGNVLISVEDGLVKEISGALEVFEADFCIPGVGSDPPTIETKKVLTLS